MNTKVAVIVAECDSIMSLVGNVNQMITSQGVNTYDLEALDIETIFASAEEMQTLALDLKNDYFSVTKSELDEQSITLYQDCKYILEAIEDEYSSIMTPELSKTFVLIRDCVDRIRTQVM